MELPEESLAYHHRRTNHNHISVPLALHNLPDQLLLPNIRKHSFPGISPGAQCCVRDILRINSHLPLSRNETNPDLPRTGNSSKEEGSATEDTKAASADPGLAAQACRSSPNHLNQNKTTCPAPESCSSTQTTIETTRGSHSEP